MDKVSKKIMKSLNKAAKSNTLFTSTPEDIKKLQEQGVPIKEKFISYKEYVNKLYKEIKRDGLSLLSELPLLDQSIANNVVSFQYDEVRASLATVNPTSVTINAILLLEYSMRLSIYRTMLTKEPGYSWINLERMTFRSLVAKLKRLSLITKEEKIQLDNFNTKYRDVYMHMNIYKMSKDRILPEVDTVNLATGEIVKLTNVKILENEALWFVGKKLFDRDHCLDIMQFCVRWTNKLLSKKTSSTEPV